MDRSVIRRRTQVALQTISDVAAQIAGTLDIGDEASEILSINHLPKANNDPAIRSVYQLESFASLLQLIANKIGDDHGYTDTANHTATASQPNTESNTESDSQPNSESDSPDSIGTRQEATGQDAGSGRDTGSSSPSGSAVESERGGSGRGSGRGVEPGETGSATANRIEDIEQTLINAGLTRSQTDALVEAGFSSLYMIRESSDEELERVKGIGPYTVGVLRSLSR